MQIENMKYAGNVNISAIQKGIEACKPGITLSEIDSIIEKHIRDANCIPAFKNYHPNGAICPFPAASCISPNDIVVHGIPGNYIIKNGDLITIDVGTEFNGFFADSARSIIVGSNPIGQELIDATEAILNAELIILRDGCSLMDLLEAAEAEAINRGATILPQWGGHYIGNKLHLPPFIPNALDRCVSNLRQQLEINKYKRHIFRAGDTICLEPVVTFGDTSIIIEEDGWTVRKLDSALTAHTERCLLITEKGYELLS